MERLVGLETEYGLYIEGIDLSELVVEARRFVQAGPAGAAWDYREEDPLQDLRGFRAPGLKTNPKDEVYERLSRTPPPKTPQEDHVDRVLINGARFYHDHGHPEYSTPECISLKDLVAHDRAGEMIVWDCALSYRERTGRAVAVYKNNTDYHGMSYGCHENYLLRRDLPFEQLVSGLLPFLVTRIIYAGAGKVGAEVETEGKVSYQLSQRAEFFDKILSIDTLHCRPLINTRDEPHADPRMWRRLHIICGDANLSEYATALKVGTTALVLDLLEAGRQPPIKIKDPIEAIRRLSHDSRRWTIELEDRRTISAVEVQRLYLRGAQRFSGRDEETDWLLREWEAVLDDLESDPLLTADRLDWTAKLALLRSFSESEGIDWHEDLDLLRSLELEYHSLDPSLGLFRGLEAEGAVRRITSEAEVERAMREPPHGTRAALRGLCLRRFQVRSLSWGRISLVHRGHTVELDLRGCVGGLGSAADEIPADATLGDVLKLIAQIEQTSRR